jgi:hypothetical protein
VSGQVDATRTDALRLAGLHVRTGAYRLARVELEELAGRDSLDGPAILDLAEVRWRTGDLRGAAAAAAAWLKLEGGEGTALGRSRALAHVIVAEIASVRGRPDDLAEHLTEALLALGAPAAAIPAMDRPAPDGTPQSGGGPESAEAADSAESAGSGSAAASAAAPGPQPARTPDGPPAIQPPTAGVPLPADVEIALDAVFAGIPPRADAWPAFDPAGGAHALAASADGARDTSVAAFFEPEARAQLLAAADARRRAGQLPAAAEILALALRDEDASATDILGVAEAGLRDADRAGAAPWARLGLVLVRADALHVLGRHEEAAMAYAAARRLALADTGSGSRGGDVGAS